MQFTGLSPYRGLSVSGPGLASELAPGSEAFKEICDKERGEMNTNGERVFGKPNALQRLKAWVDKPIGLAIAGVVVALAGMAVGIVSVQGQIDEQRQRAVHSEQVTAQAQKDKRVAEAAASAAEETNAEQIKACQDSLEVVTTVASEAVGHLGNLVGGSVTSDQVLDVIAWMPQATTEVTDIKPSADLCWGR